MINFAMASPLTDNFRVDIPGTVSDFSLGDFLSIRDNGMAWFFSTFLSWRKPRAEYREFNTNEIGE